MGRLLRWLRWLRWGSRVRQRQRLGLKLAWEASGIIEGERRVVMAVLLARRRE